MSWIERSTQGADARDGDSALTGGPGQVPTAGDIAAEAGNRPAAGPDEALSDPDVAATTLDSGDPGVGLGSRRDQSGETEPRPDSGEDDVPRDRGGEVAGGAAGALGGVVVGTVVAGPAGAVIGGIVGAAAGDVAGRSVERQAGAAVADGEEEPEAARHESEADPLT